MGILINQKHLSLNEKLAKEANKLAKMFNIRHYSKIEEVDSVLLKRDISVEKKKRILIKKLHETIVKTFSINKKKFNKKALNSLKKKLHNIRKILIKLRSINYYLETTFLEDLNLSKIKISSKGQKLNQQANLARDELEALEYTTYKLIEEVVMLDKRLLSEYSHKEKKMLENQKIEVKGIGSLLKKESELLEHLEAKLPPPKSATIALMKEPAFTNWVARIFALLAYLECHYHKEMNVFSKLKRNKSVKTKISKKISYLIKEKSKLLRIMEEKTISMKKFSVDEVKKKLHNFTSTINL